MYHECFALQKIVVDADEAAPVVDEMDTDEKELIYILDASLQKKNQKCK